MCRERNIRFGKFQPLTSLFTLDHSDLTISNFMENSIGVKRGFNRYPVIFYKQVFTFITRHLAQT